MTLTRRNVLTTAAAGTVAAAAPAVASAKAEATGEQPGPNDRRLIALKADYEQTVEAINATPEDVEGGHPLAEWQGRVLHALDRTPADSVRGAAAKLGVTRQAVDREPDGIEGIEYRAICEVERVAGESHHAGLNDMAQPGPNDRRLWELHNEWTAAHAEYDSSQQEAALDRASRCEAEMAQIVADTPHGARAQIAVLEYERSIATGEAVDALNGDALARLAFRVFEFVQRQAGEAA